jgi:hypothetical protein
MNSKKSTFLCRILSIRGKMCTAYSVLVDKFYRILSTCEMESEQNRVEGQRGTTKDFVRTRVGGGGVRGG